MTMLVGAQVASLIEDMVASGSVGAPVSGGTVFLADITAESGSGLKTVILGICGTIFTIVIVVKILNAWAEEKYGKMVTLAVAGAVVALFVFFPDTGVGILKSIGQKLGSGS